MQFCFIRGSETLTLPVTPERYTWSKGRNVEKINISQIGDINLAGGQSRYSGMISCMFPAHDYAFNEANTVSDPQRYIDVFSEWLNTKEPVRYIVTGTDINALVYIREFSYGEHDGSRDVYADISLEEYVDLEAKEVERTDTRLTGNASQPRTVTNAAEGEQAYTIVSGDTLSSICRRYYGQVSARYYNALASYNGLKNPHLIFSGTTIKIPPETVLLGGAA